MPLTGQAKIDYQREYMRRRRAKTVRPVTEVRPKPESVRPVVRPPLTKERQLSQKGFNE